MGERKLKNLFVCNNMFQRNDSTSNIVNILLDYIKNKHEIFVLSKARYNDKFHKCFKKSGIKYILFHPLISCEEVSVDLIENYNWKRKDKFEKMFFAFAPCHSLWKDNL